ncbi:hypothetical protein AFC81_10620 [Mycobacterium avium subsp. paratuberculosis]|nr:hypothetical protein RC58_10985 [Mycobacterium avium subsp. paratuberculosis]ETB01233.1 hypothetical protein O979_13910 [Mycobacterium avium subsp. paratuberculosis 10-4404]ETB03787.1 hypothetical protein O978_12075 [Mycobacterium avium subsp. paratuberculosis 10-5864]ETB11583.1 hypothetical protein O980_11675 [Mycobacterium avium subsp. paratuberculosis 08-8281]ETB31928.1 hypothetical protein O977_12880 [Mycobacterium avium subsp. paratuberculosis 10-5975]ETB39355.1 hypothetical protein O9
MQYLKGLCDRGTQLIVADNHRICCQATDAAAAQHFSLTSKVVGDFVVGGSVARKRLFDAALHIGCGLLLRGQHQVVLATKMVIEAALANTGLLQDRGGTGANVAAIPQQFSGSTNQSLA